MAELPGEVERFIADHIESIEQLEILLLLRARPNAALSADDITRELRLGRDSALPRLEQMAAQGLASSEGNPPRFRLAAARGPEVDALARCYAERKVTVITQIFTPRSAAKSFADAFKLRGK